MISVIRIWEVKSFRVNITADNIQHSVHGDGGLTSAEFLSMNFNKCFNADLLTLEMGDIKSEELRRSVPAQWLLFLRTEAEREEQPAEEVLQEVLKIIF